MDRTEHDPEIIYNAFTRMMKIYYAQRKLLDEFPTDILIDLMQLKKLKESQFGTRFSFRDFLLRVSEEEKELYIPDPKLREKFSAIVEEL
jgi:hypothetical protein